MASKKSKKTAKRAAGKKMRKRATATTRTHAGGRGKTMTQVGASVGRSITTYSIPTGWDMSHSNAPRHPDLNNIPGHRIVASLSPADLYRGTSGPNKCFWMPDGYAYNALTPNPIYKTGVMYERLLGQDSPMQVMGKMYVRYALRGLKVTYTPTNGMQETGSFILVWHPSGPTELPYTTFQQAKNVQGAISHPLNTKFTEVFINDVTNSPARRLYYVDPSNVALEDLAPGQLLCFMDATDGTGRTMGNLYVEFVYDFYTIQGNTAPSMEASQKRMDDKRLQQLKNDLALLSASTSSVTSQSSSSSMSSQSQARMCEKIPEQKESKEEKKERIEDFYLVPRRAP